MKLFFTKDRSCSGFSDRLFSHSYKLILSACIVFFCSSTSAQPFQWQWAKGAGGSHQDDLLGGGGSPGFNTLQLDSSGNAYEVIKSKSASMDIGAFHFTNPGGSGFSVAYFAKYDAAGTVLWAKTFPRFPAVVGGGSIVPQSMFTTKGGYSYLILPFLDSIRLGNAYLYDSSIHSVLFDGSYCVAKYDPAGNVVSLHAHKSTNAGLVSIMPYFNNQMLALVSSSVEDTLDGHPFAKGFALAIMDSIGKVILVKNLGSDSSNSLLTSAQVVVGGRSVFIRPNINRPAINQSSIPIGDMTPYSGSTDRNLIIKMDSLLNFKWFRVYNHALAGPMVADQNDNLCMSGTAFSTPLPDTLILDTSRIALPYIPPFGTNNYINIAHINRDGNLHWTLGLVNNGTGVPSSIYADDLGNVYLAGRYGGYLWVNHDTLAESSNVFIAKVAKDGHPLWLKGTHNAQNAVTITGIRGDGRGNTFINGQFSNPVIHPYFGTDSLTCHTPVSGASGAADIYIARLGNCGGSRPTVSSADPLSWCGADSALLISTPAYSHLWSTGDTSSGIQVRSSGTYYVYSLDSLGCYRKSAAVDIHALPRPILDATVVRNVNCYGGNDGRISIRVNGGNGPYAYTSIPPLLDTLGVRAAEYRILATDSAGCLSQYDTVIVTQPSSALSVATDSVANIIGTAGSGIAIATATGGTAPYKYLWDTNPAQLTDTARNLVSGWYSVTVTDSNGCQMTDSAYIRMVTGTNSISAGKLSLYPNPANDFFYVTSDNASMLNVYDESGKCISRQAIIAGVSRTSSSQWPAGIYSVEFTDKNGSKHVRKLVIAH